MTQRGRWEEESDINWADLPRLIIRGLSCPCDIRHDTVTGLQRYLINGLSVTSEILDSDWSTGGFLLFSDWLRRVDMP